MILISRIASTRVCSAAIPAARGISSDVGQLNVYVRATRGSITTSEGATSKKEKCHQEDYHYEKHDHDRIRAVAVGIRCLGCHMRKRYE